MDVAMAFPMRLMPIRKLLNVVFGLKYTVWTFAYWMLYVTLPYSEVSNKCLYRLLSGKSNIRITAEVGRKLNGDLD